MSRINGLLKTIAFVIAVLICFLQSGCVNMHMKDYSEKEVLECGSEFEAAQELSSRPEIVGEPLSDSSALIGKWIRMIKEEHISLNANLVLNSDVIDDHINSNLIIKERRGTEYLGPIKHNNVDTELRVEEYDFKSDGTYSYTSSIIDGKNNNWDAKNIGSWSLKNGELTLVDSDNSVPKKLLVTVHSKEEIYIQFESASAAGAQYSTNAQIGRKFGWDRRGYFVQRVWLVGVNNLVREGTMFILADPPDVFKRVDKISK
ncbi:MAG: lipocalin family protein [Victivallales bacterium]|nr:lipocalin family protein [Victivallales bacterium]